MSAATIQEMVAEKIKTLYRVSHEWRGAGGLLLWADAV